MRPVDSPSANKQRDNAARDGLAIYCDKPDARTPTGGIAGDRVSQWVSQIFAPDIPDYTPQCPYEARTSDGLLYRILCQMPEAS